jgi:hypothetical protein
MNLGGNSGTSITFGILLPQRRVTIVATAAKNKLNTASVYMKAVRNR